jgi:hypothetical protein
MSASSLIGACRADFGGELVRHSKSSAEKRSICLQTFMLGVSVTQADLGQAMWSFPVLMNNFHIMTECVFMLGIDVWVG